MENQTAPDTNAFLNQLFGINQQRVINPDYRQPVAEGGTSVEPEVKTEEPKTVEKKAEVKKVVEKKEEKTEQPEVFKQFLWNTAAPIELDPVFGATRSALGLSVEGADSNSVADIGASVATLLQDDSPRKVFSYIAKKLTSMPRGVANPVHYLHKLLTYELIDFQNKRKKGGKHG